MTANTAESLLREFARKRTNKSRAAEELAKSAATLILPRKMLLLPMSKAADIVELLAAGFARASRPTKVVLL